MSHDWVIGFSGLAKLAQAAVDDFIVGEELVPTSVAAERDPAVGAARRARSFVRTVFLAPDAER